ncbi:MAG: hypothetical protein RIT26_916 [Pseudomonadota bacterium]
MECKVFARRPGSFLLRNDGPTLLELQRFVRLPVQFSAGATPLHVQMVWGPLIFVKASKDSPRFFGSFRPRDLCSNAPQRQRRANMSATLPWPVLAISQGLRYDVMMRKFAFIWVLWASCALAEPAKPVDDIERFLNERGVLEQTGQFRQRLSQSASDLVVNAMGFLGVPYKRGGNTVENGFDCSGFVRAVFEQTVGAVLPRRARDQAEATQKIDRQELQPGDLVFFNTMRQKFSHVGIYIGDNKFIHSPKPGQQVQVEDMRQAYWDRRFTGARRVPTETTSR